MALIVEDGTGRADSESYISLSDATARHAALGNVAWAAAASDAVREQALRRATTFMLQAFRQRWTGYRVHVGQSLDWPRYSVTVDSFYISSTIVPADIANACADLALKALAGDLAPDLQRGVLREKVGPIETEYDPASPQSPRYTAIQMLLAPYLTGGSSMARLVRA